jgi:hypothetical protein
MRILLSLETSSTSLCSDSVTLKLLFSPSNSLLNLCEVAAGGSKIILPALICSLKSSTTLAESPSPSNNSVVGLAAPGRANLGRRHRATSFTASAGTFPCHPHSPTNLESSLNWPSSPGTSVWMSHSPRGAAFSSFCARTTRLPSVRRLMRP